MSLPLQAALWMTLSALGASFMNFAVRGLSVELSGASVAFLRMAFGSLLFLPLLLRPGQAPLSFSRPWRHVLRGALVGVSTVWGFEALTRMPLATATALFFLAPIFVTAFAALLRLEKVGIWRWGASAAGFLGALIILRPASGEGLSLGAFYAVGSSALFAAALLVGRPLSREDGALSVMVSSNVVGALAGLPWALSAWGTPSAPWLWGVLAAAILAGSIRSFADIKAYDLGEAGFLAPFSFLRLIFVAVGAWLLFDETPDARTLFGATLIVGASVATALREARRKRPISRTGLPS
ncbi:DMT family transporter [Neomegalonema sp.]|uniref:DMT family transporter n=1 Tax=Neomegalonema sp. TaxID=2039713 RepID=UPI0026357EC8|nr:DMT family transporter [Neomegalonema sp.]MDD2867500.1 DMT family transporter [Neomegalonema sp.]